MYVCLCFGITDKDIQAAVAGGATDLASVVKTLGLGQQCGRCLPIAQNILSTLQETTPTTEHGLKKIPIKQKSA
jgi:bacterioferritin-associated ferredoxin